MLFQFEQAAGRGGRRDGGGREEGAGARGAQPRESGITSAGIEAQEGEPEYPGLSLIRRIFRRAKLCKFLRQKLTRRARGSGHERISFDRQMNTPAGRPSVFILSLCAFRATGFFVATGTCLNFIYHIRPGESSRALYPRGRLRSVYRMFWFQRLMLTVWRRVWLDALVDGWRRWIPFAAFEGRTAGSGS